MKRLYFIILFIMMYLVGFSQIQSNILFYVNTDSIIENNQYHIYQDSILPYIFDNVSRIKQIDIISSASPEGNHNEYLANIRAQKIKNTLPDIDNINIYLLNENYQLLKNLIYNSNESYKNEVLYILNNSRHIKSDLKKLYNGFVWNDMLKKYFPQLRQTTIKIYNECEDSLIHIYPIYNTDTIYINKNCQEFIKIPIIAIKTNLLLDAIAAVNIQAEWYTWWKGISLEFEWTFPWYSKDSKHFYYQLLNGTFGIRKYLNNKYTKTYIGIYGNTGYFDFCFKEDNGYQGEHKGAGISFGYVFQYKKLKIEPYIRVGWLNICYDKYYTSNPYIHKYYYTVDDLATFKPRNRHTNYFGPTMIGVNLTYDLIKIWKRK